jgi:hypothetical protein
VRARLDLLNGDITAGTASVPVKTQFAPAEVHAGIVKLLRHLKKKYFPDLEVSDEGGYWETGDLDALREKQALLNEKMDLLASELGKVPAGERSRSPEELADLIEDILRRKEKEQE